MADYAVSIPQQPTDLLPIQQQRTYKAQDGSVGEKFKLDVTGYGINEIRRFLVAITGQEMQAQIDIQNPPAFADVDGIRGRGIASAQRKVVVSFGNRLKMQALTALKTGLKRAIDASTQARSGKLGDMSNWQWRYVRNGRVQPLPIGGASGIPMGPDDVIYLMPVGVTGQGGQAYATAVNMRVSGAGKLSFRRTAKGKVATRNQGIGYLALAARAAAASPLFGGFNVLSGFTVRHAVAGEVVNRRGKSRGPSRTGFIKISPKRGGRG